MKKKLLLTFISLLLAMPCLSQRRDTVSSVLHFNVNESILDSVKFHLLIDSVSSYSIDSITVTGHASPEGNLSTNENLSTTRSKNTADSLYKYLNIYPTISAQPYHWRDLTDSLPTDAINIIRSGKSEYEIEQKLRNSAHWRHIRNEILPKYRSSEISFYIVNNTIELLPGEISIDTTLYYDNADTMEISKKSQKEISLKEPYFNIGTNYLADLAFIPRIGYAPLINIEAEYYSLTHRFSTEIGWTFPWWSWDFRHDYFQILNLTVREKYFFQSRDFTRHYIGAYVNSGLYDIEFDAEDGWQGEHWGVGMTFGYKNKFVKSGWSFDIFVQIGYLYTRYDDYSAGVPFLGRYYYDWYESPNLFIERNKVLKYFGPTDVGISLKKDIAYRKKK